MRCLIPWLAKPMQPHKPCKISNFFPPASENSLCGFSHKLWFRPLSFKHIFDLTRIIYSINSISPSELHLGQWSTAWTDSKCRSAFLSIFSFILSHFYSYLTYNISYHCILMRLRIFQQTKYKRWTWSHTKSFETKTSKLLQTFQTSLL